MGLYDVVLGIDRAARDTHQRMTVRVRASDRLSAAIAAEKIGDCWVKEPQVEYTHAMQVHPVKRRPAFAAVLPMPQTLQHAA